MNESLFNQSYFSEAINGFIFVLGVFAVGVFARWLFVNRKDSYKELRPALAVSAVFLGETTVRFSFWIGRHETNVGLIPNEMLFYCMSIVGGAILAWGMLCCMKVFAPEHCSFRVWLYALIAAALWNLFWMEQFFF